MKIVRKYIFPVGIARGRRFRVGCGECGCNVAILTPTDGLRRKGWTLRCTSCGTVSTYRKECRFFA